MSGGGGNSEDTGDVDSGPLDLGDLREDIDDLAGTVDSREAREELRELDRLLVAASDRGLIDPGVRRLDAGDVAEAFVGSVVFVTPLLVEDGVFDIAAHLLSVTVAGVPVFLVANTLFVLLMTYALVEWTGRDTEERTRFLGVFSGRVPMILAVSFGVTAGLMAVWGRLDGWATPLEALARVNVLWAVGALGAALGDLLPGSDDARKD